METYIKSIHIKQFKCVLQHYWFQIYSCLFWLASTMIIHEWKDMISNNTSLYHSRVAANYHGEDDACCLSDHEEYDDDDDEEEEEEEEEDEYISDDDKTIVTTTVAPWSKEPRSNEETSTLHSFDTTISSHQSESKSFTIKRKKSMALNNIKNQMAAWKQKHFQKAEIRRTSTQEGTSSSNNNNGLIKLFSKKHSIDQRPRISLATFRRKTSPSIY